MELKMRAQRRATQGLNERGHKSTRLTMADTVIEAEMMCERGCGNDNELRVERMRESTSNLPKTSAALRSLVTSLLCAESLSPEGHPSSIRLHDCS